MNRNLILLMLLMGSAGLGPPLALLRAETKPAEPQPAAADQLHNRVIYVPYGQLDRIFGDKRKGILMTYDRYLELWQLAESHKPAPKPEALPVRATIEKADYRGAVTEECARFQATFTVRILGNDPVPCPFDFQGVGLSSVTVDGRGASLFPDAQGGLSLLLEGEGQKTVQAAFSARVASDESRRSVKFGIPCACAGAMALQIPAEAEVQDSSVPVVATKRETGKAELTLAVGANREIALAWTLLKKESSEQPLLLAESAFRLDVRPDALRLDADSTVTILRAELSELSLALPARYEVVSYDVPDLQGIETVDQDGAKQVRLKFHEPQKGTLKLKLSAEAGWEGSGPASFPALGIAGALRHSGKALIRVHPSLEARAGELDGARQVALNAQNPPEGEAGLPPWRLFDFWRSDFRIGFEAAPLPTETAATVQTAFQIGEEQWSFLSRIHYQVRKGERLNLRFRLPDGWTIQDIRRDGTEAEWYETTADGARLVEVEFPQKVVSGGAFGCQVSCRLIPDNWLPGDWESRDVPVPLVWVEDASEQEGSLELSAAAQFELDDRALWGLKPQEAQAREGDISSPAMLRYTYRRPYGGSVAASRRSPRVSADVTQYVSVERDVCRTQALVAYTIQYAATDQLWVALPKGTGAEVDIQGEDLKEKTLTAQEAEDADLWRIALHRKRIGPYPLRVAYERKVTSGQKTVEVGGIRAVNVGRVVGCIGVEASSDIELHPQTQNLIDIDVADVPKLPFYRSASRLIYGYKWLTTPFRLSLDIIRHGEETVLGTVVSDARYRTVVGSGGLARTQATLTVRNASAPQLRLGLPQKSGIWSVLVNGEPVKPSVSGAWLSVPLAVAERGEAVSNVVLTYQTAFGELGSAGSVGLSGVKVQGVPVISSEWELYLPERYEYLSRGGNMKETGGMRSATEFVRVRDTEPRWAFIPVLDRLALWPRCQARAESVQNAMRHYTSSWAGELDPRSWFRAGSAQLAGQTSEDIEIPNTEVSYADGGRRAQRGTNRPVDMLVDDDDSPHADDEEPESVGLGGAARSGELRLGDASAHSGRLGASAGAPGEPQQIDRKKIDKVFHEMKKVQAEKVVEAPVLVQTGELERPPEPKPERPPEPKPGEREKDLRAGDVPGVDSQVTERRPLLRSSTEGGQQVAQLPTPRISAESGTEVTRPAAGGTTTTIGRYLGFQERSRDAFFPPGPPPPRPPGKPGREARLLSLTIEIPSQGLCQSFKRLGGDPEIHIGFVSRSWSRVACALLTTLALLLSALVCRAERAKPLSLLLVSGIVLFGAPEAFAEWLRPFCHAVFYGIAVYAALRLLRNIRQQSLPADQASGMPALAGGLPGLPTLLAAILAFAASGPGQAEPQDEPQPWKPGRTIYVPYSAQKPEQPKTIDKVYLPYTDFLELWQAAYPDKEAPKKAVVTPFTVVNATYQGAVQGRLAAFSAAYEIEVLADEWTELPLALTGVALREATLDGSPATLSSGKQGYSLSFAKPGRHVLNLSFTVPVTGASGSGGLSFNIPAIAASRLVFELPSNEVVGQAEPCGGGQANVVKDGKRSLEADIGRVTQVAVSWKPRAALSANGLTAHVAVTNQLSLTLQESYLEARSLMTFGVTRKSTSEVTVRVPKPLSVYSVSGETVKSWKPDPNDAEVLHVSFAEPVHGETAVAVHAGAPLKLTDEPLPLPLIAAENVASESGTVTLLASQGLKVEVVSADGLRRSPTPAGVSAGGEGVRSLATYAYPRSPVKLAAKRQLLSPAVAASVNSVFLIDTDEVRLSSALEMDVKASDLHELAMELPKTWEIDDVQGASVLDWWTSAAGESKRVHVAFKGPVRGKAAVELAGSMPLADPARVPLAGPRIPDAEEQQGTLFLAAKGGFSLTTRSSQGLRPRDVREFAERQQLPEGFVPAMAYSYREPAHSLEIARSEVKPYISATTVTRATLETGVLRAVTELRYDVRNSAVDTLSFSLPGYVGNQIEMKSPNIRQVKSETVGEGGAARRVWTLKLHTPQAGTVAHRFDLELGVPEDGDIRIPDVRVLNVDRARHYVVFENHSEYVVKPKTLGNVQEVPPAELPFQPSGGSAAAATVYKAEGAEWAMEFGKEMTRMQQLVEASIDWAEIKSSVTRDSGVLTAVVYHMQNRTEQYLEVEMPEKAEVWSVFVRNEPVRPAVVQRGQRANLLIPLIKTTAGDLAFDTEIVYSQPLTTAFGTSGSQEFGSPKVIGVPVTHTHWTLYLPPDFQHWGFKGNMDEVVEEVKLVDKLATLVKEQTELLRSVKFGKGMAQKRAYYNVLEQEKQVAAALKETKERVQQQQDLMQQKKLGRYQKAEFKGQVVMNAEVVAELEQQVTFNGATIAAQGQAQPQSPEPPAQQETVPGQPAPGAAGAPAAAETEKVGALSIRVDIPKEGVAYHFKKLQGDAKIRFRYVSEEATGHAAKGALVAILLVVVFTLRTILRRWPRLGFSRATQ